MPEQGTGLLAALRRPIDELCSRGLPNLAHPDGEERVLELAAQMADAAGALAAAFAGKSARTASEAEVLRRKKTAEDLAQLATSAKNLGRSPLGERQRVVALGLRPPMRIISGLAPRLLHPPTRWSRAM